MPVRLDDSPVLTDGIVEHVTRCMNELALVLADPFQKPHMDTFAEAVKQATEAEGVSMFTLADDNASVLVPAGAVGYTKPYREHTYLLRQPALTTYVYRNRQAINMSRGELERPDSTVPFSGVCETYLESGHFYNIIATPILYGYSPASAKCLGVLKLENQGQDTNVPFRPESFALARILAEVIAIALEQRRVADLLYQAEMAWLHRGHKSLTSYREKVVELIQKLLDAEAVALYHATVRSDGRETLRHDKSVGFRKDRARHDYELVANPAQNHSVISRTARRVINGKWSANDLTKLIPDDPFVKECVEGLPSGGMRSLLIFPVHNNKELLGALAVVNKVGETTTFDVLDEQACRAFAHRHIVPYLESVSQTATNSANPNGLDKLVEKFGMNQPLKGTQLLHKILEIEEFRQALHLHANDCGRYLGLTRENYLNKLKQAKKTFNQQSGSVTA